ncbi:FAD-binding protein, partial [Candidatus Hodgkinia cicadicola]
PELQIGHSGKIISPKIYIAFGISGSNHHMIGVKNVKTIISVNTDINAPIVKQSDYILIMDMFKVIPEMIRWLIRWKAKNKQLKAKSKTTNII